MKPRQINKKEWWQEVFDEDYIKTYIDTTPPKLTKKQVSFLIDKLGLTAKNKILDLGCGYGRHTLELAKRGFSVIGFDYSKSLLAIARQEAKKQSINAKFIKGDMRKLDFKNEFDVVVCMFTSFGYFSTSSEHEITLRNIAAALKSGGKFLLDTNNLIRSLSAIVKEGTMNLQGEIIVPAKISKLSNGLKVALSQKFDLKTMRWKLIRRWTENGKKKEYASDIRLFTFSEIKYLLEKSGFKIEQTWGNFEGAPFGDASRRLIILAKKEVSLRRKG